MYSYSVFLFLIILFCFSVTRHLLFLKCFCIFIFDIFLKPLSFLQNFFSMSILAFQKLIKIPIFFFLHTCISFWLKCTFLHFFFFKLFFNLIHFHILLNLLFCYFISDIFLPFSHVLHSHIFLIL